MRNLAIVPARGGSKRLKKKNIRKLDGKPLVQYTLEAVAKSEQFETIILSSDDEDILAIADSVQGVTPEKRDESLAGDKVKVIDLIKAIADRPGYAEKYDTIGHFLPTCPFRSGKHIREALGMLTEEDLSVVSVCEMEDPVQLTLTLNENNVMNPEAIMQPSPLVTGETRAQDFDRIYRVNGGFYIAWLEKFREKENYFQGQVKGYVMDNLCSVDIDYPLDFEWAQYLLDKGHITLY